MKVFAILFFLFSLVAADAQVRGEFLITNHGAVGDGEFDNAPIINELIERLGPSGGSIVVPHGDFRINGPIMVRKSFVTLRGLGHGSKILVGPGVGEGVLVPNEEPRISGLTVRNLHIAGMDNSIYQTGILIDRPNDGVLIADVMLSNLRRGLFFRNADAARIIGNTVRDSESSLLIVGGFMIVVNRNHFSGFSGGTAVQFESLDRVQFTGNVIMPDGQTALRLLHAHNCNISGNTITTWYTGAIEVVGNMNSLSGNNISAVEMDGGWLPDPIGRDTLWGLVRIEGNDNTVTSSTIISWQPENDTRVNVLSGDRNVLRDLYIGGIGSDKKISVDPSTRGTRITHSGLPHEINLHGNQDVGVVYDP